MCYTKWSVTLTRGRGARSMNQLSLLMNTDDGFSCTHTCRGGHTAVETSKQWLTSLLWPFMCVCLRCDLTLMPALPSDEAHLLNSKSPELQRTGYYTGFGTAYPHLCSPLFCTMPHTNEPKYIVISNIKAKWATHTHADKTYFLHLDSGDIWAPCYYTESFKMKSQNPSLDSPLMPSLPFHPNHLSPSPPLLKCQHFNWAH